jgi:hypothetical protein
MDGSASFFSTFLNYGGLGVLALVCVIVLGYQARSLDALVKDAPVDRLVGAKPLLQMQMVISVVGLLAVGGAAFYLAVNDQRAKQARHAQLLLDPWPDAIGDAFRPEVDLGDGVAIRPLARVVAIPCPLGQTTNLHVDMEPYVTYRIAAANTNRTLLTPPGPSQK